MVIFFRSCRPERQWQVTRKSLVSSSRTEVRRWCLRELWRTLPFRMPMSIPARIADSTSTASTPSTNPIHFVRLATSMPDYKVLTIKIIKRMICRTLSGRVPKYLRLRVPLSCLQAASRVRAKERLLTRMFIWWRVCWRSSNADSAEYNRIRKASLRIWS